MTTVTFLGATGFVGGSVLVALAARHLKLAITALVRNSAHVDVVRATGVTVLQGSFKHSALVEVQICAHDIVINPADFDDLPLIEAVLRGAKKRADEGKPHSILIQTSGTGVFLDDGVEGKFDPAGKMWNDNRAADIKGISPMKIHGDLDIPFLKESYAGYVDTYIICPGAVMGTCLFIKRGRVVYRGEGSNEFPWAHMDDLLDLYLRIFDLATKAGAPSTSAYERYFITAGSIVSWKAIATSLGAALARRASIKDGTAQSVPPNTLDKQLVAFFGASVRVVTDRSNALGWTPKPVVFDESINVYIDTALDMLQ